MIPPKNLCKSSGREEKPVRARELVAPRSRARIYFMIAY
jgi:hypothetical protein